MQPSRDIDRLIEIMAVLRTPGSGCPWDLAQSFGTIAPYTIEEAYEVADAIERGALGELRDELGDLLLQVVFHARMAEEQRSFAFGDVVQSITEKLIRRHPHVFGSDQNGIDANGVRVSWEEIKAAERAERTVEDAPSAQDAPGTLAGVPRTLPGLTRAMKLQARAGRVGFDWNDARLVLAKIREELDEVEDAIDGADADAREEEVGDLLFAIANLARHLDVDPEMALRRGNSKFERRFAFIEAALAGQGRRPDQSTLAEMDGLWDEAKAAERSRKD